MDRVQPNENSSQPGNQGASAPEKSAPVQSSQVREVFLGENPTQKGQDLTQKGEEAAPNSENATQDAQNRTQNQNHENNSEDLTGNAENLTQDGRNPALSNQESASGVEKTIHSNENRLPSPEEPLPSNEKSAQNHSQHGISAENRDQADTKIKFHSQEIGEKIAKKEDPFYVQNQKHAEKREQQQKQQRILIIAAVVLAGLAVLGIIIWLVVANLSGSQTSDQEEATVLVTDGSDAEIDNLRDLANRVENGESVDFKFETEDAGPSSIETGEDIFAMAMDQATDKNLQNQVRLAEIYYQFDQANYEEIAAICSKIEAEALSAEQQQSLYTVCADAYSQQGEQNLADEYRQKSVKVAESLQEVNN